MSICAYLREIGRGRHHAKNLDPTQAQDLMGQILDGTVSDLELGAFCVAMRVKGESQDELTGFMQAAHARMTPFSSTAPCVVIPSYNGARRLPLLTPLLAGLLAKQGVAVLIHGMSTEPQRVACQSVIEALRWPVLHAARPLHAGEVVFVPTAVLNVGLQRLLDVRRSIGLRNSGHSLVKLLCPVRTPSLLITSYTHPEYATTMSQALAHAGVNALLLRGTEGEAVADPRRLPLIEAVLQQQKVTLASAQTGPLEHMPSLPEQIDAHSTARFIEAVLAGHAAVPAPIQTQVQCALDALAQLAGLRVSSH